MFVIQVSYASVWDMSPSTGHQDQTENALKFKQSLNYDTYYFLLVVKTKKEARNNSIYAEQLEHK